jgi:hypothetical protein
MVKAGSVVTVASVLAAVVAVRLALATQVLTLVMAVQVGVASCL